MYASSSMVYGEFDNNIPDETVVPKPNTLYGSYKRQGEIMCKIWHREYGLDYVIMRPSCSVRREGHNHKSHKPNVTRAALTTGEMTVQGPDNKLDFSNVLDVAKYFSLGHDQRSNVNETFNCTRGNGRKIVDAAEIIKSKLGTGHDYH